MELMFMLWQRGMSSDVFFAAKIPANLDVLKISTVNAADLMDLEDRGIIQEGFYADFLIVILNNDRQRALKGAKEFMLEDERAIILRELRVIDEVFISVDTDKTQSRQYW